MNDRDFQSALIELRHGIVPESMRFVVEYVLGTTKERNDFTNALLECVARQNNTNKVLREMNEKLNSMNEELRRVIAELQGRTEVNDNVCG
jgi:hypothetical protein